MSKNQSLSLRTQWLGDRLKAARVAAGLTLADAAAQLHLTDASLSRFEKGFVRVRRPYVKEMIDFYGVSNRRERDALLKLNDDSWRKDWWDGDTSDLEMGFLDYTWIEARSSAIFAFEPSLVHGLLQTFDYALAVTRSGLGSKTDEATISRMVDLRMTRQRILNGDHPTTLSVIMEEAAIRRPIGGSKIVKSQLEQLLELSQRSSIAIRILSTDALWNPGHHGSFAYFEMPDPYPEVAYVENLAGRTFLEDENKVSRFRQTYDELEQLALSPSASAKFIRDVLKDLE